MTFCSSIASFGMTTFWVSILGATILADSGGLSIPYIRIFISLLSLIVPLCLGILFAKKKPKMAKRISKTSRPIFLTFLLGNLSIFHWTRPETRSIFFFMFSIAYHNSLPKFSARVQWNYVILSILSPLRQSPPWGITACCPWRSTHR